MTDPGSGGMFPWFDESGSCGIERVVGSVRTDVGSPSGVALGFSSDASSPKKVLKTPLCCHAWMKNSCCAGSLITCINLLPSGCFR